MPTYPTYAFISPPPFLRQSIRHANTSGVNVRSTLTPL